MTSKRKYETAFKHSYSEDYPSVVASKKGGCYAFCTLCLCDFSIMHGGKNDIVKHLNTKKHMDYASTVQQNKKLDFSSKKEDAVTRAESYFTAFIVEHNLPISCADHAGPIFRKMFPDSEIAKKYGSARTKTTAIVKEMSRVEKESVVEVLRKRPFSIATDGSNKGDSKLFPMVVSYFNEKTCQIESSLLSVSCLQGDSTGHNIAHLILDCLRSNDVPLQNCLALGADNAPVMIGKKMGVAGTLTKEMNHLVVIGCCCHLINLAAEKGSECLKIQLDEMIIDIFYYLDRSSKRKEKLKHFQLMYDTDVRKILKHVSTRWLSLGRCLDRLVQQWEPLTSFFKDEVKNSDEPVSSLKHYSIPKKTTVSISEIKPEAQLRKVKDTVVQRTQKISTKESSELPSGMLSRQERLFFFLSSNFNKAMCSFLLNVIPVFEERNVQLQSSIPHIHVLRKILLDMFKDILSRFVLPSAVKSADSLLSVLYSRRENQRNDSDLVIGQSTAKIVEKLKEKEKKNFFVAIRQYFVTVCNYIIHKFPLTHDVLVNSEVASISSLEEASFSKLKFFLDKFPGLIKMFTDKDDDSALDALQNQFCTLQLEDIPDSIKTEKRIDTQWSLIGRLTNSDGQCKYDLLSKIMLAILTIPHSNAECERVFSLVTKAHTQFRSSLSAETLQNVLIVKSNMRGHCFEQEFSSSFLNRAKSATVNSLKKD